MAKPIREQVIVITGASSGIGLVTARMAARRGARVVLAARNRDDLGRAAASIEREGGAALAVPTDVTSFREVEALARHAVERFGRVDTWVNNAAVSAYAPFRDLSLDDARRIMEVNFIGQLYGAKVALPLLEQTGGALICVGSTLSDRGVPLQGIYCASKHALKGWLDSLRVELQKEGSSVRVTLIKPSSIDTPLFKKAKTQLGVAPQPIPPVYHPALAAEAILHAAVSSERDLFVGGAGKLLSFMERVSPKLVDMQQRLQGFRSQKTNRPKPADAPNNLYEPIEHDGGERGDIVNAHQGSAYQAVEKRVVLSSLVAATVLGLGAQAASMRGDRLLARLLGASALGFAGKSALAAIYQR